MNQAKNIILCDCHADEVVSLCSSLNSCSENKFSIKSHISNWKRTGKFSEIKRYAKYFAVAWKYFLKRKDFDVIVGWQQFYTLIFAFFCATFKVKKRNILVALNFTYKEKKGKVGKIYHWFMSRCVQTGYMDCLHVLSYGYAKEISKIFNFPMENILVTPFGVNDPYEEFSKLDVPAIAPKNGYALAIGRSNRDYDFLINAWENINYPLVIISDTYKGESPSNANVRILRNVAGAESYPWIANCNAMIIPIDDGAICSGDTVLLNALAMKKKVLVTAPSTLAEMYIVSGENALAVQKEKSAFEKAVLDMLFSDTYDFLGEKARESYLNNFSRASMGKKVGEYIFK